MISVMRDIVKQIKKDFIQAVCLGLQVVCFGLTGSRHAMSG